jgi:hypothetical protein
VAQVVDALLEDAPRLIDGLRRAVAVSSPKELRLYAHTIRTNCMTLGLTDLGQQFLHIERTAAAGTMAPPASVGEALSRYELLIELIGAPDSALVASVLQSH